MRKTGHSPAGPALFAAWLAATAPAGAGAEGQPLWPGYEFAPYGQFHFAYQSFDDGQDVTAHIVDVTNANSRVGFYLQPDDGRTGLSFHFESGLGFRPSQKTSQTDTPAFWNWQRTDLRKVQLVLNGDYGTLRLGQGSMPTDGAAEADLGGTVVIAKSTIPEGVGSYILRLSSGGLSPLTLGDTFDNFDGDRRLRLRYDTPAQSGVSVSAAFGREVLKSGDNNDYYGFALRYGEGFGDVTLKGALGATYVNDGMRVTRTTLGSLSLVHEPSGLNLSLAAGQYHTGPQPRYLYLKAGWNRSWSQGTTTKFVAELFRGWDYASAGARSRMWSIGMIQEFERRQLETYVGYRAFAYDDLTPASYLDSGALQIGARWRY